MNETAQRYSSEQSLEPAGIRLLRALVFALLYVSGGAVFVMIAVICADVVLRLPWVNHPFIGAYDLVRIAGAIALAAALPYTTAVKGHVAIEYFFHKLNRASRLVVDSMMRLLSMALFGFLGWQSLVYGKELYTTNQVSQTLKIPLYWLPIFIGGCCFVVVLVVTFHLICPKREMIKP